MVVVFPSLPVTAYIFPLQYLTNSSISDVIYAPSDLALTKASLSILIEGVLNTTSNPVSLFKYPSPSISSIPFSLKSCATSPSSDSFFISNAVTLAPSLYKKFIKGIFDTPIPTTATFLPLINVLNSLKSFFILYHPPIIPFHLTISYYITNKK